jgi:hypothetical protein
MKNLFMFMLVLALLLCGVGQAQAGMIDFSNNAVPGTYNYISTFDSSGFHFQSNSASSGSAIDSATESDPNLQHPAPGDLWAVWLTPNGGGTFSPVGGGTFTLNSIDVSWFDRYYPLENHTWSITGTHADLTTTTVSGTLQPSTFTAQTLNWTNLTSVSFSGNSPNDGWMGVNNIVVNQAVTTAAPEPASMTLLGLGIAGLAGYGLRRRKPAAA